jgi:hypothetical protein
MIYARIPGWITLLMIFFSLLNLFLKQISRDYVKRLPKEYKDFADAYRSFMRRVIRGHRFFGLAALLIFAVHAFFVIFFAHISLTGIASAIFLIIVVALGAYGYFIKRDFRAWWLSAHRASAFFLCVAVITHVFYKLYIF